MRIVEREEIFMTKCYYCGAKNKLKISYGKNKNDTDRPLGIVIRCCNCGRVDYFSRDWSKPLNMTNITKYPIVDVQCIQQQACPHKDCPYYGKKPSNENKVHNKDCTCDDNCDCNCVNLAPPPKFK